MVIALTWQEGVLEEAKAEKVMKDLENELHLVAMEYDLENLEDNIK